MSSIMGHPDFKRAQSLEHFPVMPPTEINFNRFNEYPKVNIGQFDQIVPSASYFSH